MKAAVYHRYGLPDVLSINEIQMPKPGADDILVKVMACTVNRTDCANLTARPAIMRLVNGLFRPRRIIPGTDFAGIVEETGKEVTTYRKGDRIWGFNDAGVSSQAQYLVISAKKAVGHIPATVSFEHAAAAIEGGHYAYNFVNKVDVRPGQTVLVNGGTGAIGSAVIQILKSMKAIVTAVCRGEHSETITRLGADRIIDYTKEDFTQSNERFDYVFDAVGKSRFSLARKVLAPKGIYISSELGPYWQNTYLPLITAVRGTKKVKFPLPLNIHRSINYIGGLLEAGQFEPLIDRKYALDQVREAYQYVMSGQKVGNVFLIPNS